jgi:hypothetical protein
LLVSTFIFKMGPITKKLQEARAKQD